jgi:hypothetical protein
MQNVASISKYEIGLHIKVRKKFPMFSTEKIRTGVFFGPQLRQLFKNPKFKLALSLYERAAWNAFRHSATGFLGNLKAV